MTSISHRVQIVKNISKVFSGEIAGYLTSIISFLIVTNIFTKIEIAMLSVMNIITGFGVMIIGLGLINTMVKEFSFFIAKNDEKTAFAMVKSVIIIHFVLGIFICLLTCLLSKQISQIFFKTKDYNSLICIIASNIIAYKLLEDAEYLLVASQKFGQYSIVRSVGGIFTRIIPLGAYFVGGIKLFIVGVIICNFILFLIIVFGTTRLFKVRSGFYPFKKLIICSLPFYGNAYANFAAQKGDQLIIGVFLSPSELAAYYVARRFFEYFSLIIDAILKPINVKLAEFRAYGVEKVKNSIFKAERYVFLSVIPLSFFLAVSGETLFYIFGKGSYMQALPAFIFLCLAGVSCAVYSLIIYGVYVIGKPLKTFYAELVRGITNFFSGLVLVRLLGITGLGMSVFLSFFVASIFAHYLLKKLCSISFNWDALKKILLVTFLSSAIVFCCQFVWYKIYLYPIYLIAGITVFFVLLIRYVLNSEDVEILKILYQTVFTKNLLGRIKKS